MQKSEIRFLVIIIIVIEFGVLEMSQASTATDVWDGTEATSYAGGLAAWAFPGDVDDVVEPAYIANCYTSGSILIQTTNFDWTNAGGLVGYCFGIRNADPTTTFRNCCSTVDIRREA